MEGLLLILIINIALSYFAVQLYKRNFVAMAWKLLIINHIGSIVFLIEYIK